jgi:NTP pyrophosphatase (non-canonical NTP hydrolase)
LDKLLQKIIEFREKRDWGQFHSSKNLVMALVVEVGELAENFLWLTQQQSRNLPVDKKEAIRDEIGDVLIYLINLSDKLEIDPMQAAFDKLKINNQKYPVHKVRGKSLKYDEY